MLDKKHATLNQYIIFIDFDHISINTNSFGVPMVLPGIYFNWESQGALHFKVAFPEGIELGYRISDNFDLKLVGELSGMTAETKIGNKSTLLGYQQIIAGLRPQFKLGEHWTYTHSEIRIKLLDKKHTTLNQYIIFIDFDHISINTNRSHN